MNPSYSYDMPSNYYFGGGGDTSVTLMALILLLVAMGLIIGVRRRYVIVVLLATGLLTPSDTHIVIAGLHFPALRLLLGTAWLRLLLRREIRIPRMNSIDKAFLVWALGSATFFCILWGTLGAVTNRLGFLWTTLGSYFLVRLLIRNKADVARVIQVLAITITIIAPALLVEHFTQHNLFTILGAPPLSAIRDGAIRAQGPFRHPIIAGTVGAMLLPLFVGLWWQGKQHRTVLATGMAASIGMAIASASSTPLMTCAAGIGALLLWPYRARLRILRWGAVLGIVWLHLMMKAPVWMLIARAGGTLGGSGYHRAMLIDNFIRHFGEWWLVGTRANANWGYDMWDVDNAFVAAGVGGGLVAFIAFIALFVYAYKQVGKSRQLLRSSRKDDRLIWALGASLFANTVGFFGIVYFDQSILPWYSLLAMISATPAFLAGLKQTPSDAEGAKATIETVAPPPVAVSSWGAGPLVDVTE
jgi:hypothetical protein